MIHGDHREDGPLNVLGRDWCPLRPQLPDHDFHDQFSFQTGNGVAAAVAHCIGEYEEGY